MNLKENLEQEKIIDDQDLHFAFLKCERKKLKKNKTNKKCFFLVY